MNKYNRSTTYIIYFLLIALIILFAVWNVIGPKFNYKPPVTKVATGVKPSKPLQDFTLIDTNGNKFTAQSLRGQWTLLFFGYTRCPDICPRTLGLVRDTHQIYAEQQQMFPVRFVFADISSQTTDINELKQFVQNYNPEFIGVSGDRQDILALSEQLGIYAEQQPDRIDHTTSLMLIDPQGMLKAVITPPFTAQDLANDLRTLTK